MKKTYKNLIMLGAAATLFAFAGSAQAAVSGQCANCHTMHSSQGGEAWAGPNAGAAGPYSALLVNDCLGCHTGSNDPYVDGYPFVADTNSLTDDNCLAGGFFTDTDFASTDNNSNNEHSMGTPELPAGYNGTWYDGDTNGFSCAGSNGCHGNHTDTNDMDAIAGGHHNTDNAYRILYVDLAGTAAGAVDGVPAADYEEALIANIAYGSGASTLDNNVYSADATAANTISELCAICHGNFHGAGTTDGTWIRHPTDVKIPDSWDIGDENNNPLTDSDNKRNPVGWKDLSNATNTTTTGERRATCLSCHRAHGTDNADLLRWAYSTQDAGSGTDYGCLGCHDKQR